MKKLMVLCLVFSFNVYPNWAPYFQDEKGFDVEEVSLRFDSLRELKNMHKEEVKLEDELKVLNKRSRNSNERLVPSKWFSFFGFCDPCFNASERCLFESHIQTTDFLKNKPRTRLNILKNFKDEIELIAAIEILDPETPYMDLVPEESYNLLKINRFVSDEELKSTVPILAEVSIGFAAATIINRNIPAEIISNSEDVYEVEDLDKHMHRTSAIVNK